MATKLDRRTVLLAAPAFLAGASRAEVGPGPLARYERESGGRVGVYAQNLETEASFGWRADERFVMCSTFKASLAACVLARVDRGRDQLGDIIAYGPQDVAEYAPTAKANLAMGGLSVEEMCQAAVEVSDNTCANLLLARIGGPDALTAFWRATGDRITRLDHNEPLLNRSPLGDPHDTTTPAAMAGNLRRFVLGDVLSAPSRERLRGWLIGSRTGADRLRAGLPKTWTVGDKTGNNGKDAAGDLVVVWRPSGRLLICAYTRGGSPTATQLDTVFAEIGPLVLRRL